MKICLIYLPHPYLVDPLAQAPLGLLYVASSIMKNTNHEVGLCNFSANTDEEALNGLPEADVYGITVTALELLQANDFGKKIKQKFPNSKIVLGGAGTFSDEYVNFDIIDSILKGEGEITFCKMLEDIENNKLQKIYFGEVVKDLDSLPFPARHLLDTKKQGGYIFANRTTYDKTFSMQYKGNGTTTIVTSRGCPFACVFCAASAINGKVRFRSPQSVYEEIKYVLDTYRIKQFRFSDEMFTAKKSHVFEICKLIKPLGIVWRISTRVKPLDLETLKVMRASGCVEVSFGIESFDDDVLKMLNKKTTAEDNARGLRLAKEAGMMTRALFMIRTPGQTKDTVRKNIEWLKKVEYDTIAVTSFVPLPQSAIWERPDDFNIEILNRNLNDYNFYFYNSSGKNALKDIIKIKDRSLKEFNEESEYFREWIEKQGKTNKG